MEGVNKGFCYSAAESKQGLRLRCIWVWLPAPEHGRNEVGAEVLLVISREFGKSLEWLLTGEE